MTIGAGGMVGAGRISRPKLDIQLKCTARSDVLKQGHIVWSLERSHYDALRAESLQPHLLVILLLPDRETEWLEHTTDSLILRHCAYYVKMTGLPALQSSHVTVHVPIANVFSPERLRSLMTRISEEGRL